MFAPLLTALTLLGTGRGSAQSVWGNALSFDGVNDLVVVTNFGTVMTTTAITIEFWQRLNRNQEQTAFYLVPNQDYNACRFSARSDGTVIWDFGDIGIGRLWPSSALLEPGVWQHFAVVADLANWRMAIYSNGVLKASDGVGVIFSPGPYTLHLGQVNGALDDFRVWNRVRTQAEIAADMLHPLTGTEAGLVAYWKFDEAPGTAVRDSTTNQWHGYLSNEVTRVWSSVAAPNLVTNPGFEQGMAGWFGFGWADLAAINSMSHSGNNCGFVSNRSNAWCGVAQPLLGVLQPGLTYHLSAWVRLDNSASAPVGLTFLKTDGNDTTYPNVVSGTATSSQWTQLRGIYTLSVTNSLKELTLYLSGPAPGVNFYADDFVVVPEMREVPRVTTLPATNLLASGTSAAALLQGKVNPNGLPTTAWFEWGTNWRYGKCASHATTILPAALAVGGGAMGTIAIRDGPMKAVVHDGILGARVFRRSRSNSTNERAAKCHV